MHMSLLSIYDFVPDEITWAWSLGYFIGWDRKVVFDSSYYYTTKTWDKNVGVVAPTGIAASNMIHAWAVLEWEKVTLLHL